MSARSLARAFNPGNVLVLVGIAALVLGLRLPYAMAKRVARVESRAARLGELLLSIARERPTLDLGDSEAFKELAETFARRWLQRGVPRSTAPRPLRVHEHGFIFEGKHYLFLLTRTPREVAGAAPGDPLPFEVYAWPRSATSPGEEVFFFPGDASADVPGAARTRNLHRGYTGLEHAPFPGAGRPRTTLYRKRGHDWYRGRDDERWILLPAPARRPPSTTPPDRKRRRNQKNSNR